MRKSKTHAPNSLAALLARFEKTLQTNTRREVNHADNRPNNPTAPGLRQANLTSYKVQQPKEPACSDDARGRGARHTSSAMLATRTHG